MPEVKRGCGFRKVGSLYLVGEGLAVACDRLPLWVRNCARCGYAPPFSRGIQRLNSGWLSRDHHPHEKCTCGLACPICTPLDQDYALMHVGAKYYTPRSFIKEAELHGVSKAISSLPKWLVLNHTWVLLAHQKHMVMQKGFCVDHKPAVFYAFKARRVEKLIWESEAKPWKLEQLKDKGLTPVIIKDGTPQHWSVGGGGPSRAVDSPVAH